jgi:hypothetical protein
MKNQKANQKSQLTYEFGILMQPLEELARKEQQPTPSNLRVAIAKVQAGDSAWRQHVKQFTTFTSDIFFSQEHRDIAHVPELCLHALNGIINDPVLQSDLNKIRGRIEDEVKNAREKFLEYIDRIPIEWEPVVFEANTPFTSYLRIKESIHSVRQRLHYFDRYLKPDFFELFLASVDRTVETRLVTTAGDKRYGVASVIAISKLARQEFANFKLIEVAPTVLHDRNLRVDDQIFNLGPGVDRAGMALTNFGLSDSSKEAHRQFDQIISKGHAVC